MSAMLKDQDLISVQEVRSKVEEAYAAWQIYRTFSQDQVDSIVEEPIRVRSREVVPGQYMRVREHAGLGVKRTVHAAFPSARKLQCHEVDL